VLLQCRCVSSLVDALPPCFVVHGCFAADVMFVGGCFATVVSLEPGRCLTAAPSLADALPL
jgi:hypothetical protein